MDKHTVLRRYFGHDTFRPGQEALIDAVLSGRDALGVMPTGGGKSMCYQVPALLLPGVTLVISPLISLMKDQVAALRASGVGAVFLNSSMTTDEFFDACRGIDLGLYKLIYVAPERLGSERFLGLLRTQAVSLAAVDEAHCISQWGQDFRPSYLRIPEFLEKLPSRPVVAAFTATATAEVRRDIVALLGLRDPAVTVTGFDRPNLFFDVTKTKEKLPALLDLLAERQGKSGIVYCATRANVEKVCAELNAQGIPATRYHAGLTDEERRQNQEDFQFDRKTVMVATNAFGMGIDKSNVGFVIHYNMPKSLEAYYQEAGRAGRDGEAADCILLWSDGDIQTARFLLEHSGEDNEEMTPEKQAMVRAQDRRRLDAMVGYCKTTGCLRAHILDYFGQEAPARCGNCGNCLMQYRQVDITREAQMVLSCVKRVRDKLGYYVGTALIVRVLRGSRDKRIKELELDGLSTYGLLRTVSRERVRQYIERLEAEGYLVTEAEHSTLRLTARAGEVLFRGRPVTLTLRAEEQPEPQPERRSRRDRAERPPRSRPAASAQTDGELMTALKFVRYQIAQEEGVPLYIIFSNATLADMAEKRPHTMDEFLEVSGVGQAKASRYGKAFLDAIEEYEEFHGE